MQIMARVVLLTITLVLNVIFANFHFLRWFDVVTELTIIALQEKTDQVLLLWCSAQVHSPSCTDSPWRICTTVDRDCCWSSYPIGIWSCYCYCCPHFDLAMMNDHGRWCDDCYCCHFPRSIFFHDSRRASSFVAGYFCSFVIDCYDLVSDRHWSSHLLRHRSSMMGLFHHCSTIVHSLIRYWNSLLLPPLRMRRDRLCVLVQSFHSKCYPTDAFVGHDLDLSAAKWDPSSHHLRRHPADQGIRRLGIVHATRRIHLEEKMSVKDGLLCRLCDFYLPVLRHCGVVCGVGHVYSVYLVVLLNCSSEVDLNVADAVAVDDVGSLVDGISVNQGWSD